MLKGQEDNNESDHAEIETVIPNTENGDLSDDMEEADSSSKDPEISNDKNDEDSAGVETVTPS